MHTFNLTTKLGNYNKRFQETQSAGTDCNDTKHQCIVGLDRSALLSGRDGHFELYERARTGTPAAGH